MNAGGLHDLSIEDVHRPPLVHHAVVAYGLVKNGDAIVHHGYSGYPKVVLAGGLVGTNTKFWIK